MSEQGRLERVLHAGTRYLPHTYSIIAGNLCHLQANPITIRPFIYLRNLCVSNQENHMYCTNKFIELANDLKKEGIDIVTVSGSLMTASSIYATYVAAGNSGALESSGVDKVVDVYRRTLEHHQVIKKAEVQKLASVLST